MLVANNISFIAKKKFLLDGITLEFRPGLLYGILGPNGSGKTTLLKTLSGIWQPTQGQVLWQNSNLLAKSRLEISRLVSYVPQSPVVPFDFTAWEMVAMGRYPHGQSGKTEREKELIEKAFAAVNAQELISRKMSQLSVGERQRLYIARALVTESPVLLLDEPTASLDIRHELDIWDIVERLLSEGKTVIAALHDLGTVQKYCHEVVALKNGKCIINGPTGDSLKEDLVEELYDLKLRRSKKPLP